MKMKATHLNHLAALRFRLLALEETAEGLRASCLPSGMPRLLATGDPDQVKDYHEQIARNTSYIIHPEEILAENFVLVAGKSNVVVSPRIPYLLRQAINRAGSVSVRLPARRFCTNLVLPGPGTWAIEVSTDLAHWKPHSYTTDASPTARVMDLDAWLYSHRFSGW
jgi:hypothetical protein